MQNDAMLLTFMKKILLTLPYWQTRLNRRSQFISPMAKLWTITTQLLEGGLK